MLSKSILSYCYHVLMPNQLLTVIISISPLDLHLSQCHEPKGHLSYLPALNLCSHLHHLRQFLQWTQSRRMNMWIPKHKMKRVNNADSWCKCTTNATYRIVCYLDRFLPQYLFEFENYIDDSKNCVVHFDSYLILQPM